MKVWQIETTKAMKDGTNYTWTDLYSNKKKVLEELDFLERVRHSVGYHTIQKNERKLLVGPEYDVETQVDYYSYRVSHVKVQ